MNKKPKNISDIRVEHMTGRLEKMISAKDEMLSHIEDYSVYIAQGNSKTGVLIPSVSLIPVYNCGNCAGCKGKCYDLRNDCIYPVCAIKRAPNAAIWEADPDRYFYEINKAVGQFRFFRWHIGGDIVNDRYLRGMVSVAQGNPHCTFLAFTKMYDIVNRYLSDYVLPQNLKIIFSAWLGVAMENPYELPTAHVVWADGRTTAHDGAKWCSGNCTECARIKGGCWTMGKGDEVIFPMH